MALGVGLLAACVIVDIALDSESAAIVGSYVIAPFAAALLAGPALTGGVGLLALAAAAASPAWNMNATGGDQIFRLVVIVVGTGFAIAGAWARERSRGRSERLRLLDAVGAVADGSLPLSETLERVSGVIVPGFADLCMIDAIHDGRANRLATRVGGREDAAELEARIHRRPATLPRWLVAGDRPWRTIHSWWPRVRDEELRRMSNSDEDLEFLRSLGINSTIVVPLRARDRNLGTLTAVVAWSGRRYSEEDVRFAHILAGRIALALDNAGLFSDLESIERRMDTVMAILDEAIVIHGADGELVFANPAAARSLGYETAEEAVSKRASDLRDRFKISDESGRPVGAEALGGRQALAGQVTAPLILRIVDRRTSEERWVRTKARPIEGASGDVLYSVTAIEDVTDVKRAEFANRLLARTGELVSHSVDYVRTLEEVPKLLVPEFADWCSLDVPREDGTLERVAMAHSDPERMQRAQALRAEYPADAAGEHPVGVALRTGEAQVIQFDDDDASRSGPRQRAPRGDARDGPRDDDRRPDERRRVGIRCDDADQPRRLAQLRRRRRGARQGDRQPRRARDRDRADRRGAGPDRRRAPARAAASEPSEHAGLGDGDHVRAGGRDQRGRRRFLRGLPGRGGLGSGAR